MSIEKASRCAKFVSVKSNDVPPLPSDQGAPRDIFQIILRTFSLMRETLLRKRVLRLADSHDSAATAFQDGI